MNRRPEVVYFDIETGGLHETHPNIQLAAVAIDQESGQETDWYQAKIKFDPQHADPEALAINHYTAEAWKDAADEAGVVHSFEKWLKAHATLQLISARTLRPYTVCKLIGHNAATFDGPRLKAMFDRQKKFLPVDMRIRCTLQRALWYFDLVPGKKPDDYKLETLCKHFGVPVNESHEALSDVRATVALDLALRKAFNNGSQVS